MAQGTTQTNKSTTLIHLGGASDTLEPGTALNVYFEDGVYGSVTVTSGPHAGDSGTILSADYNHPLTPFPSAAPVRLAQQPASKAKITEDKVHFVPWDRIPILPGTATVNEALRQLQLNHVGGLIVTGPKGDSFVKGAALAQAVLAASQSLFQASGANSEGTAFAAATASWNAVLSKEIGTFLDAVKARLDIHGEPGVVPVAMESVTAEMQKYLGESRQRAIAIRGEGGGTLGLFFSHESFADVFRADPPIWLCEKVPPHENTDPDHGNCSFCFRKLVKVK